MLSAANEKLDETYDSDEFSALELTIDRAERLYDEGDYEGARRMLEGVVPEASGGGGILADLGLDKLTDLQKMYLGGGALAVFVFGLATLVALGSRGGGPAVAVRMPKPLPPGRHAVTAKRMGILSTGMFLGVLMGLAGIVPGLLYGFLTYVIGEVIGSIGGMEGIGSHLGMLSIVGFPLLFGIVGAIAGAAIAVAFDLAAGLAGGVRLELEGQRLKRMGVWSLAKQLGAMAGILTLGPGLVFFALRGGLLSEGSWGAGFVIAVVAAVIGALLSGTGIALVHNLLARLSGGVELGLAERRLKRVGVGSMARFQATTFALAGLVQGALVAAVGTLLGPSLDALIGSPGAAQGLGLAAVAVLPLVFALVGALVGVANALVLNLALWLCGGLGLELVSA